VFIGVDMALKHDSTAVVSVQVGVDGAARVQARLWFPAGQTIDVADVEGHLRDLHRRWQVAEIAYDPAYFQRSSELLSDDGLPMVEFGQSAARMVPACQVAYEWICAGRVIHDGSPGLTDQVLSAVPRQTDTGWRLSKAPSRPNTLAMGQEPPKDRCRHRHGDGARPGHGEAARCAAVTGVGVRSVMSRPCLGCQRLIATGSRCSRCASAYEVSSGRRARKAARYDSTYRRARAAWAPIVAAGGVRCGFPIVGRFDLDHVPSGELQPSHETCDRSAGRP
jgi:Terminase large subunit, endonuclease domain